MQRVTQMSEFDTSVFDRIVQYGSAEQRTSLARQLAAFLADPETPVAERKAVVPAVVALASDWFLGQPAGPLIWIGVVVVSVGVLIASGLFERPVPAIKRARIKG